MNYGNWFTNLQKYLCFCFFIQQRKIFCSIKRTFSPKQTQHAPKNSCTSDFFPKGIQRSEVHIGSDTCCGCNAGGLTNIPDELHGKVTSREFVEFHKEPIITNLARAFRWQALIDSGKFSNVHELAKKRISALSNSSRQCLWYGKTRKRCSV